MPKSKRLSLRLDEELDQAIAAECASIGCSKSEYVEGLLRANAEETRKSVVAVQQGKEVKQGKVSPKTYVLDMTGPRPKATAVVIDGKEYKYCDQCKKYYRRDATGNIEYYGPL